MLHSKVLLLSIFARIDIAMLVYFRIVFGLTVFAWASKALLSGLVEEYYIQTRFHFVYAGFDWVEPLPGVGMYWLFIALICCACLVVVGLCYRIASVLLACGFTYVFLIDGVYYQNHYYLLALLCWIMTIVPAHRAGSLDALWRPGLRSDTAPAWSLALLRFQIAVPYFFGGVAKINSDWLQGQPMRDVLAERATLPLIGPLLAQDWAIWLFSYGGLFFDLLVVPALCWRRTRPWAFGLALAFHLTNATLFHIGVFPWFMILATVLFFPANFPRQLGNAMGFSKLVSRSNRFQPAKSQTTLSKEDPIGLSPSGMTATRKWGASLLAGYVMLQVLLPFRHLAYSGNVSWTERGHRFAWHMMLRGKRCGIRYYAVDLETRSIWPVGLRPYLSEYQLLRFGRDPRMIRQLGQFIVADLRSQGYPKIRVHVLALVSLNGRKPQLMIDPEYDLAVQDTTPWWKRPAWIPPLVEPFQRNSWDVPLEQWERHVDLPAWMVGGSSGRK